MCRAVRAIDAVVHLVSPVAINKDGDDVRRTRVRLEREEPLDYLAGVVELGEVEIGRLKVRLLRVLSECRVSNRAGLLLVDHLAA